MKKVSVVKANVKSFPKQTNMKLCQGDQEKSKPFCLMESDCMVESQAEYIENLQQQIYVLEKEIGYLTYLQESTKQHPSMIAEGEKMVKKLADCHKEIKNLKIELKRKQTSVDLMRSERDRIQRYTEELEEKFRKEKCSLLEDIITIRKERDAEQDRNLETEKLMKELQQNKRNLQEDLDNIRVEMEQIKRERLHDKEIICGLLENKEKLQTDLFEARMRESAKTSEKNEEAIKVLKDQIEMLHELAETSKRSCDHERLLRERMAEDNAELIRRHAELETELAETKAQLREEQSLRSSLEQIHLTTVLEASEAKSRDLSLKEEIEHLKNLLKEESERSYALALQVADEQRFKAREEEKFAHLQQRFDQREENIKAREKENIELLKDNTYLKDQVVHLKQQLQNRDDEVLSLKQKVQEMQVSVEEFIQSSQAATRLAGERWKQLGQLAQSIQALTCIAEPNS